ncbi:MAG TPA: anti-sigma factor [Polyangiales bacterium]|nr:anti-sigma factor [Polyangiales bacterium]
MNCTEFHDLAAAYALDALSEDERLACVHHLEAEGPHEDCEALVLRYERTVDALSQLHGKRTPEPALWGAIEARIGASKPRWREPTAWALAAAALLAGVWTRNADKQGIEHVQRERQVIEEALANTSDKLASTEAAREECSRALLRVTNAAGLARIAASYLENPNTKLTTLAPTATQPYAATVLYNPDAKRALIVSGTMQPAVDKDYELWVIAAGETTPRPAGFLRFDADGIAIGEFGPDLLRGKPPAAFAVSIEPRGGSPTPTEVVLLGKLQG